MSYKIVKHCMYPLFSILSCKHGMYLCKNNDYAFCGVFENFTSEEYILNNFRTEMSEMGTGLFLFNTAEDAQELLNYLEPYFIMGELIK